MASKNVYAKAKEKYSVYTFQPKRRTTIVPYKNPTGYTKPYTRYSDNDKMNTSGHSNQVPMDIPIEKIEIVTVGPIRQYKSGGVVYTNKNDEDTKEEMKDLKT